jgi:hypothetical protein
MNTSFRQLISMTVMDEFDAATLCDADCAHAIPEKNIVRKTKVRIFMTIPPGG